VTLKSRALFVLAIAASCAALAAGPDEKAFLAENQAAMAQEIIVTQQQEIVAMRRAVGEQP
jgi:hypothetical protein